MTSNEIARWRKKFNKEIENKKSLNEGKETFQPDICNTNFGKGGNLNKYVTTVHEGKKPFQCYICNVQFIPTHGLKGHIAAIHVRVKKF